MDLLYRGSPCGPYDVSCNYLHRKRKTTSADGFRLQDGFADASWRMPEGLEIFLAESVVFIIEEVVFLLFFNFCSIVLIVNEETVAQQLIVIFVVHYFIVFILKVRNVGRTVIIFKTDIVIILSVFEITLLFHIQLIIIEVFHGTIPFEAFSPSSI